MDVLLGVGGTDDSLLALRETVARTAKTGDRLGVAILENPASDRTSDEISRIVEEVLTAHTIEAEIVELEGDAGPALADYAEAEGFDRIVLGGGMRSPMGKITIGGIAEFVLLNADTSITLIR